MASTPSEATCRWMNALASRKASCVSRTSPRTVFDKRTSTGSASSPDGFHDFLSLLQRQNERWNPVRVVTRRRYAAVALDNLPADGQTYAGAGELSVYAAAGTRPRSFSKYCESIPSPLSLHRKYPFLAPFFGARRCVPGIPGLWYLMAFPTGSEITESVASRPPGRWAGDRASPVHRFLRWRHANLGALLQCFFTGGIEQILSFCPDTRIGQQILDQPLHAAGPIHCEGNELIGVGVQLSLVPSG